MPARFQDRVDRIVVRRKSLVCVGLDPDPARMPPSLGKRTTAAVLRKFNDGILRATQPFATAYKMQFACYLRYGAVGITELERLARKIGPEYLRILDLKANDIPNIMGMYRDGAFRTLGYDAITVSPWLGWETLVPLSEDARHGFFVVAHSSNPGSQDFQEIPTPRGPLWQAVVGEVGAVAAKTGNAGVVVGATYADAIRISRQILGNGVPILVPGVGAQGGALSTTVREGVDGRGRALLISASRSIIYASAGEDWARAAHREAERLTIQINQLREGIGTPRAARR
ncbi:MAG: orotidine-5'-phosphate decarboxylase [Thermoplasmata archaeon]